MNKHNWVSASLDDVTEINPTLNKTLFSDDLIVSFIPMSAVDAGTGKINVSNTRRFGDVKKGYTPFREGDVLFAKITPCMENGKMAIVPAVLNNIGFGSTEFHVLRPRQDIDPSFIYYFVSSEKFRYDAERNMTGAVGQRRVSTSYLKSHSIPIPPFAEQKRIVAKIEELFSEIDRGLQNLEKLLGQLKSNHQLDRVYILRQSILKKAFSGDLVPQTIDDEPAKILLERISTEKGNQNSQKKKSMKLQKVTV